MLLAVDKSSLIKRGCASAALMNDGPSLAQVPNPIVLSALSLAVFTASFTSLRDKAMKTIPVLDTFGMVSTGVQQKIPIKYYTDIP